MLCFIPSQCATPTFLVTKSSSYAISLRARRRQFRPRHKPTMCVRNETEPVRTDINPSNVIRTSDTLDSNRLANFSNAVKGEWAGFEGEFDASMGEVRTIPNYYIPEDFTTWGLEPKGFECNHSSIVRGTKYYQKFFRVLPTVALFADHVDLETTFTTTDFSTTPHAHYFSNGSYTIGASPVNTERNSILDTWPNAELCIRHESEVHGRRAIHAKVKFDFTNVKLVETIRIVKEKYSCIYCDGADIEGSSGYVEGWPDSEKSKPSELIGNWKIDDDDDIVIARPTGGAIEELGKCLYLPCGISLGINESTNNEIEVWLGWLVDESNRLVMRRYYDMNGNVTRSKLTQETRTL